MPSSILRRCNKCLTVQFAVLWPKNRSAMKQTPGCHRQSSHVLSPNKPLPSRTHFLNSQLSCERLHYSSTSDEIFLLLVKKIRGRLIGPRIARNESSIPQHPLDKCRIAGCRIVDKHMGHRTDQTAILNDGTATHSLHDPTGLLQQFWIRDPNDHAFGCRIPL